ncbi:hypothetical protein G6F57_008133 [Rhizopus arrhizus]|uniref:HMG box domain-containing protein n=1 Tax=Rhizopus oryzae TaxID=64495 RepID=A0A9P6X641_RHIOR|nr:hypothetical protein G6F21_007954 [Rhizopus arrhizus]KAG1413851.1 hypothetical protein G6F58_007265 [Rhizopus delemar]KAG0800159.1 hypothetical protein G6F22_002512 [Rhizopus arrhizus]KAG0809579.1 hypothetical protein G6F20_008668 [Rhizopus arrhizus]KAG0828034.1 hypothetical protein G6F19_008451 [Rhizopus arrhizus]
MNESIIDLFEEHPDLTEAAIEAVAKLTSFVDLLTKYTDKYRADLKRKHSSSSGKSNSVLRKNDPDYPKPPLSSFFLFIESIREETDKLYPSMHMNERAVIWGQRWRALSEEDRKHFNELAENDRERHRYEMAIYEQKKKLKVEESGSNDSSSMECRHDVDEEEEQGENEVHKKVKREEASVSREKSSDDYEEGEEDYAIKEEYNDDNDEPYELATSEDENEE